MMTIIILKAARHGKMNRLGAVMRLDAGRKCDCTAEAATLIPFYSFGAAPTDLALVLEVPMKCLRDASSSRNYGGSYSIGLQAAHNSEIVFIQVHRILELYW